jgi:hypothetical protein
MHNNYTKRESNMHNYAYVVGVLIGYHHPKCFEHDIVAIVPRLKRALLEIAELGFNRSFDDMNIIEVTDLFCSWVTFTLAIRVCWVFTIGSKICEEVLNVSKISLPYVHCFVCLLLMPFVDNSCIVYYFLQFLVKNKNKERSRLEFVSFSFI